MLESGEVMTKIAILGTGRVGTAIWKGIKKGSDQVKFGSRNPSQAKVEKGSEVIGLDEAAKWADVIVLAVPHKATEKVIKGAGEANFKNKVVIDVTNAINDRGELALGYSTSGAEDIQKLIPNARVVKAFNTVFAENMEKGKINKNALTLFVASDDKKAKEIVMELGRTIGFRPVDAGPLKSARYLEPMGMLLINLGYGSSLGTKIGFLLVDEK